jgi:pilus assembly protein CpaF
MTALVRPEVARPVDTEALKSRVRSRLVREYGERLRELTAPEQRLSVRGEVLAVLREERAILPTRAVTDVANEVSDEVVGLGPVERLLKDPEVSEVMVNGADDVFVERKGRIERVEGLLLALIDLAHLQGTRRRDRWNNEDGHRR